MPESAPPRRAWGRLAGALAGLLLLVHLVRRAGPARLWEGIAAVGWGLALILALAGLSHAVRTRAWRLTLPDAPNRPSFWRMFALRLVSEAAGQIGVFGQVFGDTWRVARLGAELPLAGRIASVALDRTLYTLSSTIVTIAGVSSLALLLPLSGRIAVYANVFAFALIASVCVAIVAVRRRWGVLSATAGVLGRLGTVGRWLESKRETIQSVEDRLLDFFHHSPRAAWESVALYLAAQVAAVMEVFLILRLMGCRAGVLSALAIEGLTKLLSVIGMINPGNAGTFEGGNMLLAKLAGMGATAGLTMGLIRRVRALFWAAVGAVCAVVMPGSARREKTNVGAPAPASPGHTSIILARGVSSDSMLARVGALPVLLRAILGEKKTGAERIIVVADRTATPRLQEELRRTGRLPDSVEWRPADTGSGAPLLRLCECGQDRIVFVAADRTYHPSLHRRAAEWEGAGVLALTSGGQPAGICVATTLRANQLLKIFPGRLAPIEQLRSLMPAGVPLVCEAVDSDHWQLVSSEEGRLLADDKLNRWLVKPTDGVFARMNRRVSIPISRQLIKFPITPNMVSLFTLGVGFLAGAFFALGGRANMLIGALLSVFASILDGSDGEVARLTFQESAFGCWLETVCDYLYYVFIFAGMMIGLLGRGPIYIVWGSLLFFGAIASFLATALQRLRLAKARPEQYLTLWQARASNRKSNPLLRFGRHTEFLIRRCCLPYLLLAFALFGGTYMAFIGAAVGANIVWPIALYSQYTFERERAFHG